MEAKPAELRTSFIFLVHFHYDHTMLGMFLPDFLKCYPPHNLIMISDGDPARYDYYDVTYGKHLKKGNTGALWVERFMRRFLDTGAEYLIKVDTDTVFHRPIRSLPKADYFGTRSPAIERGSFIQGGIIGFSRSICERIVSSEILLQHRWKAYHYQATDFIIRDVMYEFSVIPKMWNEVCSRWKNPAVNRDYALTHPRTKK